MATVNTKEIVREIKKKNEEGTPLMTRERLESFLPKKVNNAVTDELLRQIQNAEKDTGVHQELFEEQLLIHAGMVGKGVSLGNVVNAIKFVALREVTGTASKAFRIVFPDKETENVDNLASQYARTKTVVTVQSKMMLHSSLLAPQIKGQMLRKLVNLTNGIGAKEDDYVSPTVQLNAAIATLAELADPVDNSLELKIGMSDDAKSVMHSLMEQVSRNAEIQMKRFANGESIGEVQRLGISAEPIIDAEIDNER